MKVGCALEATTRRRRWRHKESGGRAIVMFSSAVHLPDAHALSLGECDGQFEIVRVLFVGIEIGFDVAVGIGIGVDCVEEIVGVAYGFVGRAVGSVIGVGCGIGVDCGVSFGGVIERIGLEGKNDLGGEEPSIA